MSDSDNVTDEIRKVLHALSAEEQELLSRVVRVERDLLHQKRTVPKKELLKCVREVVK